MTFQGSTKFSILTRNVKAELPWKHKGSASSPRACAVVIFSQGVRQSGKGSVAFSDIAGLETMSDLWMSWWWENMQSKQAPRGVETWSKYPWFPWEELCRHTVLRACLLQPSSIPRSQADRFNREHRACAKRINFLSGHFWEDDKEKT